MKASRRHRPRWWFGTDVGAQARNVVTAWARRYRGGSLRTFDDIARDALAKLAGHLDVGLVAEIWQDGLDAPCDGTEVWFHGDVARGNLLFAAGQLGAVVDFGTCGVGDPACDLAVTWTLLTVDGRRALRETLDVNQAEWSRGRGWALWKTRHACAYAPADGEAGAARRILDRIIAEYTSMGAQGQHDAVGHDPQRRRRYRS